MDSLPQNTTTSMMHLWPPEGGEGRQRHIRSHSHRNSKSCSDANFHASIAPLATTNSVNNDGRTMNRLCFKQPESVLQQNNSVNIKNSNRTQHHYYHGRRHSLVGFDPFSSEQPTRSVTKSRLSIDTTTRIMMNLYNVNNVAPTAGVNANAYANSNDAALSLALTPSSDYYYPSTTATTGTTPDTIITMARDASPSGTHLASNDSFSSSSSSNEQERRQPPTPVGNASGNANATKTTKSPMKKVNKFLRKSVLATLGYANPNESTPSKSTKSKMMMSTTTASISPVSVGALNKGNNNISNGSQYQKHQRSVVPLANTSKGMSVSVVADQSPQSSSPTPSSSSSSPLPPLPDDTATTTMAQDLLELQDSFRDYAAALQIPSLANRKNYAPTSFLTGNQQVTPRGRCEYEGPVRITNEHTPFQLEIPSLNEVVTIARLNEFVENYRKQDQNLDLRRFVGLGRMELQQKLNKTANISATTSAHSNNNSNNVLVKEHVAIVQSLLECIEHDSNSETTNDGEISVQGFLTEPGDHSADDRTEAVIFQGQRNFTVVFRGTTEQQSKGLLGSTTSSSKSKKRAVPLDGNENNSNNHCDDSSPESNKISSSNSQIEVYNGFKESYSRVEQECFKQIDKLVDENPFCDVVFSGYSFGGALATLAAFRYAISRPMMRVGCLTLASPKVGFSRFQQAVNSLPNLKVMRLELGRDAKCQGPTMGGFHVGHTLLLNHTSISSSSNANANDATTSNSPSATTSALPSSSEHKKPSVSVYKFATPKHKNGFFKTYNPGLEKYISILEDLATLNKNNGNSVSFLTTTWAKDFANNAGEGVVINNEKRQMV